MRTILAVTWNPRGEESRLAALIPQLLQVYTSMVIVLPPKTNPDTIHALEALVQDQQPAGRIKPVLSPEWSWGRYLALNNSIDQPGEYVQYADLDRLLRWVETNPVEWKKTVVELQDWDYLIIGRSQQAYETHPQALIQTEAISNLIVSYFLGRPVDVSAGSKGFSRRAVEFLMAHTQPLRAIGADAEWTVLLQRAGFRIGQLAVDGLDWESADQYQDQAAGSEQQRQAAAAYDLDPLHWAYRTQIAHEIVQSALEAAQCPIQPPEQPLFNFDQVFEVDDYMYFYQDMLTPERTDQEVDFLRRELELDRPLEILDLACGFGRHANRLAALGHTVTGIDLTSGFLDMARKEALNLGVQVNYRQGDMRQLDDQARYDRVLLLFSAFGYFEDYENLQVMRNIAKALKPAGLLILDVRNRDHLFKDFMPYIVTEKEGNLMIDRQTFDSLTGRLYNRRIVIRNGLRRDKPFFVRMYNLNEIQALLANTGLKIAKMFGGWDSSQVSADSRRLIIIAEKSS
jgi:2-polyprenyl-3-methyl-5-hydroxy-6-metoxy-1,4-benzoquinol methylase